MGNPLRACLMLLAACLVCGQAAGVPAQGASANTLKLDGYGSIALTRLATGHLTVQATINGVAGTFVLDTGAGRSVIESSRVAKFRLNRIDPATSVAVGAGGNRVLRMSHGNRLQLGRYDDFAFTAYLMPLDQVNLAFLRRGQKRIDGVIGADVLRSGDAVIDYAGNRLYLRARAGTASSSTPLQPEPAQR